MAPIPTGLGKKLTTLPSVQCVAFDFYGTMFISGVGDIGVDEEQTSENLLLFEDALRDTGFETGDGAAKKGLQLFDQAIRRYNETHRSKEIDFPEPDIVLIWFEVLEKLKTENLVRGPLNREAAEQFAVEYEFRFNPVWPMPDLENTLKEIKKGRYLQGIISNSQFYTPLAFETLTAHSLETAGFDPDLLVWSYQASVKKPSIHFYRRFTEVLQRKHKMRPEQVLFVGNDMLKDIKPASDLGMKTALFAGDQRSLKLRNDDPECREIEPDLVISELRQLTECL